MDLKAMLATSLNPTRLPEFIADDNWVMQQKIDGQRRLVVVTAGVDGAPGVVRALNRDGDTSTLPLRITNLLASSQVSFVLDGELLGRIFYPFDLLTVGDLDLVSDSPLVARLEALDVLVARLGLAQPDALRLVPTAVTEMQKAALCRHLLAERCEGVVVKHLDSLYKPGRREIAPQWMKAKYVHSAEFVVTRMRIEGRDNFGVGVYDETGRLIEVGKVTRGAGDGARVKKDDVVEVKYLVFTDDRRLREPTLPRLRTDKRPEDCTIDQLIGGSKQVHDLPV